MQPRSIVITGAGGGIGRHAAVAFLNAGWKVILAGRSAASLEASVAAARPAAAGAALVCPADVTDERAVEHLLRAAQQHVGHLDVLFNNAGIFQGSTSFEEVSLHDWRAMLDVNLTGSFLCAQAAFRVMKAQTPQGGRIINNGSISAHVPRPQAAAYTASKHAITGLTKSISLEGRRYGIACGQIDIGNARTDMTSQMSAGMLQADGEIRAEATMDAAHVVSSLLHMASLPIEANVQFMTVMASAMPYIGRG